MANNTNTQETAEKPVVEVPHTASEWVEVNAQAKIASDDEHSLTLVQALKAYPQACFWSMAVSLAIIMEGYDIVLVGSLFAQSAFQKKYGEYFGPDVGYQLTGPWQNGLNNATTCGTIIGAFMNGYFVSKFGYRKVLISSLIAFTAFVFLPFFAPNLPVLLVGEFLCGIPWGVFATIAPSYASEVAPLALRGYLTVYVNICWAIGQLIAAGVMSGVQPWDSQWGYRLPFAIQWVWPVPMVIIYCFAPESPWWLVRTNQLEAAEKSLVRLSSKRSGDANHKATIAMMVHTNELEQEAHAGTSYWDCFKGTNLRRTEIGAMTFAAQVFTGQPLGGTPTYFFTQAGLDNSVSFKFSVGGLALAMIATTGSWFIMSRFGRRTIYLYGLAVLSALMYTVAIVDSALKEDQKKGGGGFAEGGLVLLWLFLYYGSVGPLCYAIVSEVSAVRLRPQSICLSRIAYYVAQLIGVTAEPYLVNPTEGNLSGKAGYVWGTTCLLFFVWTFFRLPETGGRTFEELDILFERKVAARKFSRTSVDAYEETDVRKLTVEHYEGH